MITYAIGAEKINNELLIIDSTKDVRPFPKGLHVGKFKSRTSADAFIDRKRDKLNKLLEKNGYYDYTVSVIRIDAPHVIKA